MGRGWAGRENVVVSNFAEKRRQNAQNKRARPRLVGPATPGGGAKIGHFPVPLNLHSKRVKMQNFCNGNVVFFYVNENWYSKQSNSGFHRKLKPVLILCQAVIFLLIPFSHFLLSSEFSPTEACSNLVPQEEGRGETPGNEVGYASYGLRKTRNHCQLGEIGRSNFITVTRKT